MRKRPGAAVRVRGAAHALGAGVEDRGGAPSARVAPAGLTARAVDARTRSAGSGTPSARRARRPSRRARSSPRRRSGRSPVRRRRPTYHDWSPCGWRSAVPVLPRTGKRSCGQPAKTGVDVPPGSCAARAQAVEHRLLVGRVDLHVARRAGLDLLHGAPDGVLHLEPDVRPRHAAAVGDRRVGDGHLQRRDLDLALADREVRVVAEVVVARSRGRSRARRRCPGGTCARAC